MADRALRDVLVIDDSADFRVLITHHLQQLYPAVNVVTFDPPSQGRPDAGFAWHRFDLVIIDYELGGGENGLEWLRAYRAEPEFPAAIVITAHGDEELAVRAMKCGAQYYLNKRTLDRDRLATAVGEATAEREEERRQAALVAARQEVFGKELFYRRLEEVLREGPGAGLAAMLMVSLDRLDEMQEVAGILEVDSLMSHLCEVAARALQDLELAVNLTRVGDGTLAALVRGPQQDLDAERLGATLCRAVAAQPYPGAQRGMEARISVGIVPLGAGTREHTPRTVLAQADVAVRMARRARGNSYFVRQPEGTPLAGGALRAALDLHSAIKENRLQPRFQPLASVSDTSAGLDAAFYQCRVRLVAGQGEPRPIVDLLVDPQGRRTLDRWVVRDSLNRVFTMIAKGVRRGGLLVRLSEDSLGDEGFEKWLGGLIEHAHAQRLASAVVFEVRAEDVLGLGPRAAQAMGRLRERFGVKFALLDAPSTSVLRSCGRMAHYAFVKLSVPGNGSLDERAEREFEDAIRAIHDLGAFAVAERIERADQLSRAIHHGVDFVQGFFIQDPMEEISGQAAVESVEINRA